MKHLGFVKADTLINITNWIGMPLIAVYLICMIIASWVTGQGDWGYVQNVWDRWQALNVGILALISSFVAFNISSYNENKQRERNFVAGRAFLPEALSELTGYFKSSAALLVEAWQRVKGEKEAGKTPLHTPMPTQPKMYKETFSRCIELAEPDVGERLAYMLMRLQVHHSRLQELVKEFSDDHMTFSPENIYSYLYRLAELQALTNRLFPYARGLAEFNNGELEWTDFQNVYAGFGIWAHDLGDLSGFTQRAIARGGSD